MIHESFNESVEMYLKTVCELADGTATLTPISALAKRLDISVVSATEMVHRLGEQGLLVHTPYKGVALTAEGEQRALRVIRRHRLWECFLADHLGIAWHAVHDDACRLEHATPSQVTEALAAFLNQPARCPHGNPIPTRDGDYVRPDDTAMSAIAPGAQGIITRVHPESGLLLDYLAAHAIRPGACFIFQAVAPLDGPLLVTVRGQDQALGRELATHIFVRLT